MSNPSYAKEPSGVVVERRERSRQKLRSVAYIDLGPSNGGLVLNLSQRGLAFSAAMRLVGNELPAVSFKLPGSSEVIEAPARIVWMSESKKEAGVEFDGLTQQDAQKISDWILGEQGFQAQLQDAAALPAAAPTSTAARQSAPSPRELGRESAPAALSETNVLTPERPRTPSAAQRARTQWFPEPSEPSPFTSPAPNRKSTVPVLLLAAIALLAFVAGLSVNHRLKIGASRQIEQSAAANKPVDPATNASATANDKSSAPPNDASNSARKDSEPGQPPLELPASDSSPQPTPAAQNGSSDASTSDAKRTNAANGKSGVMETPLEAKGTSESKPTVPNSSGGQPSRTSRAPTKPAIPTKASLQDTQRSNTQARADISVPEIDPKRLQEEAAAEQALDRASAANLASPAPTASNTSDVAAGSNAAAAPPEPTRLPSGSVELHVPPFPSMRIPAGMKSEAGGGQSLQMGQIVSRVQPEYPPDALAQQVQGSVKAHVAINDEGAVESVEASGPPLLVEAATAALRQWRFKPTLLNGKAIPADENVIVVFRLREPPPK